MGLEIKTNEINEVVVVRLIGYLDSNSAPAAESEINSWLEKGTRKLVINLEETKYVSSAGLRIFLSTVKKMTASGGVVKLCSVNGVVQEVLEISRLSTILEVKETEEQALSTM